MRQFFRHYPIIVPPLILIIFGLVAYVVVVKLSAPTVQPLTIQPLEEPSTPSASVSATPGPTVTASPIATVTATPKR